MFSAMAVLPMLGRAARMIELLGLEAAGDVVEVVVAGRDPGDRVPRLGAGGDPVHRLRHDVAQLDRLALELWSSAMAKIRRSASSSSSSAVKLFE